MIKKITSKDFKVFKQECERLIKEWGLDEWDIDILRGDNQDANASMKADIENMKAEIYLSRTINTIKEYTPNIKDTAKHEVIHLLISKVVEAGSCRFLTDSEYNSYTEQLVNKLIDIIKGN